MTDVLQTSLERSTILSQGHPLTGSCRCPVDVPVQNFQIFVLPVKNRNRCVIQGLLHLKAIFSLKHQFLCWSPESLLKISCRSLTSLGRRVLAGYWIKFFITRISVIISSKTINILRFLFELYSSIFL